MKNRPPKWADRFLTWYCREDLLDEIQGDIYELYDRKAKESRRAANWQFVWNVIRFFRIRNIKKQNPTPYSNNITAAMLKNNLTVFLRNFKKYPGHSFLSLFGFSIAFACTILIMLWVKNEFAYDQFHKDSDRLYKVISHVDTNESIQTFSLAGFNMDISSVPEVEEITFISTGSRWPHELCLRPDVETEGCVYFHGVYASPTIFSNFSFPILTGDPNPLEEVTQIAISERMARELYGYENPLGKTLLIDNSKEVSIAAVFQDIPTQSSIQFDFALPFSILQKQWGSDDQSFRGQFFETYIKTNVPVNPSRLSGKLNLPAVIGEENLSHQITYEAIPFTSWHLNSSYENGKSTGGKIDYIYLFILIAGLVLAMAVINFVNLTTARASLRAKEIGIRKAIGAGKSSLVAQFMSESFVMVFLAFLLGLIWTTIALSPFNHLIETTLSLSSLQGMNVLFLLGFLISVALLAGLYPAFVMSAFQPVRILKGLVAQNMSGSLSFRKVLMAVQLSLSIGIILFSAVIYFQMDYIRHKNLGMDKENMIRLEPTYRLLMSYEAFKSETLKNDVIQDMTASNANPLEVGNSTLAVDWQGKSKDTQISFRTIGTMSNFADLFGLEILKGRDFFVEKQTRDSLVSEAIITETAAKYLGFEDPIGEKIRIHDYMDCEIIGIVNDFHTASLKEAMHPVIIYRNPIQYNSGIYIKYKPGQAEQALQAVNASYKKIEPDVSIKYWFQDDTFDSLYKSESIASTLIPIFSLVSIVIAIIGIVGLTAFNTMRKTKEIGVRRVFGATSFESYLVLGREFTWVVVIAMLAAVSVAWYASQKWLQSYAYRTEIPWTAFAFTLIGTAILIMCIVWVQGHKTIAMNPTSSLRSE